MQVGKTLNKHDRTRQKAAQLVLVAAFCTLCAGTHAQDKPEKAANTTLAPVTITAKANRDPVEKSYRKMISGMDLFENERMSLAPAATLRFKLLPRHRDTDMNNIEMDVLGTATDFAVPIAPDHTFTLQRNTKLLDENAQVIPNRKAQSMTWRTDIRTPGLPPNTRRLGDLRLECRVGMESGLVSNSSNVFGRFIKAVINTPAYCDKPVPLYLFFAERPLFSVTLVAGARREVLPIENLYAAASDDAGLNEDLPYCDCEVLVDRTYVLPLGDLSWPNDTLVEFEFMDDN